jgi:UDP-glucose 4-epimerase
MKLLVTGGCGYIGSVVTHQLVDAGHEVVVLDDLSTGFDDNLPDEVTFFKADIHDISDVLAPGAGFDGVLHFAGKIEVAESVKRPDLYWHTNVSGTLAVLKAVRTAQVPRMIFSSTGSIYQATDDGLLTEASPVAPTNPYTVTKLTTDMMLAAEASAFGLGAVSLRYFNAAGAVGHLGERHTPESHLIPIVLRVAAGQQDYLKLYGDDYPTADGSTIRDYIHVADLARAHLLALEWIPAGRHEVFNLGNGNGYTSKQVIETVREVTGRPVPVEVTARRPGDFMRSVAGSDKARDLLGWTPQRPALRDIVRDAWEFHQYAFGLA